MKKILLFLLPFFIISFIYSVPPQQILNKSIEKILNGEKPSSLKNIFISGTINQYGMVGDCSIISNFSSRFLFQKSFNLFKESLIKDKKNTIYFDGNNTFSNISEVKDYVETLNFVLGFSFLKETYNITDFKETGDQYKISLNYGENLSATFAIDKKSLLIKEIFFINPLTGRENTLSFFNYRKSENYFFPSRIEIKSNNTIKINIQNIVFNSKLDPSYFKIEGNQIEIPQNIKIVPIPFDTIFKYPKIDCIINNSPPLTFLVDTGSPYTILDKNVAKQLGLFIKGNYNFNYHYPIKSLGFTLANKFTIAGITRKNFLLHTADLTSFCTNIQYPIHGILGMDFFQGTQFKISFDDNYIYVSNNSLNFKGTKLPFINLCGKVVVKYQNENGASLFLPDSLTLDTFRCGKNIITQKQVIMDTYSMGNDYGLPLKRFIGSDIQVGDITFTTPICGMAENFNQTYNLPSKISMVMGIEVLKKFNISINFKKREIYFEKSQNFNTPYSFNYSGLFLLRTTSGFYVDKVIRNSPSDRLGIQRGDIITNINGLSTVDKISFEKFFSSLFSSRDLNYSFEILRNGTMKLKVNFNPKYPFEH